MSDLRNAEKMFLSECISDEEYYLYRLHQHRSVFQLIQNFGPAKALSSQNNSINTNDPPVQSVNLYSGAKTFNASSSKNRFSFSSSRNLQSNSNSNMFESKKINQTKFNNPEQKKTTISSQKKQKKFFPSPLTKSKTNSSFSESTRRITFSQSNIKTHSLKNLPKKSLWNKLTSPFLFSTKKKDYQALNHRQFLRTNNLLFEIDYIQHQGPGRIGNFIDSLAWKEIAFWNHSDVKTKFSEFVNEFKDEYIAKNAVRNKSKISELLSSLKNHNANNKTGVFLCSDKVCEFCEKKESPFEFLNPVRVEGANGEFWFDNNGDQHSNELRDVLNMKMKQAFVLPCSFFGKDFKKHYLSYLKSKFLIFIFLC